MKISDPESYLQSLGEQERGEPVAVDPATKKFDVVVNINEGPNTLTFNIKDTSSGKTYLKSLSVTGVPSP